MIRACVSLHGTMLPCPVLRCAAVQCTTLHLIRAAPQLLAAPQPSHMASQPPQSVHQPGQQCPGQQCLVQQ